jgi:hypothetical protein
MQNPFLCTLAQCTERLRVVKIRAHARRYLMSGNAQFRGMVWQIAEDYACADLLLRLPGHCPMPARSPLHSLGHRRQPTALLGMPAAPPARPLPDAGAPHPSTPSSGSPFSADRAAWHACALCRRLPQSCRARCAVFGAQTRKRPSAGVEGMRIAIVSGARASMRAALNCAGVRHSRAERRAGVPGGRGRAARRAAPPQDAGAGALPCLWVGSEMHRWRSPEAPGLRALLRVPAQSSAVKHGPPAPSLTSQRTLVCESGPCPVRDIVLTGTC